MRDILLKKIRYWIRMLAYWWRSRKWEHHCCFGRAVIDDQGPMKAVDHWRTDYWSKGLSFCAYLKYDVPRACSYDGGIHPEDAIELVRDGWTIQTTDKEYKKYMQHPSGRVRFLPPVKVYSWHFSEDQKNRFNETLFRVRQRNLEKPQS